MPRFYKFKIKVTFSRRSPFWLILWWFIFDEGKYWRNCIWFQYFYVTSSTNIYISNIKMKFANVCVIYNFKKVFPTSSSECFDFITPQFIQFYLWIYLALKFKQTYVHFLPIFVILCIFTHWNEQYFPFPPILSCFGHSSTVFS